ncbi:MAG: hypothetical protein KIT74_02045 [Fimbriimonadales bacterium]|nr:hypothetical protein [Fimbriimonadales bacterium]
MSNLLPLLFVAPIPAIALYFEQNKQSQVALWVWISIPLALWLSVNFFAPFQNRQIKKEMLGKLLSDRPDIKGKKFFVGFARPKRKGAIHTHEDVGWLILHPESLEFFGDSHKHELPKSAIRRIRFGANMNTAMLLGRWILIEAEIDGKPVRLQVEPREKATMLGNLLLSGNVASEIRAWASAGR